MQLCLVHLIPYLHIGDGSQRVVGQWELCQFCQLLDRNGLEAVMRQN